jgi:hypothetical protein
MAISLSGQCMTNGPVAGIQRSSERLPELASALEIYLPSSRRSPPLLSSQPVIVHTSYRVEFSDLLIDDVSRGAVFPASLLEKLHAGSAFV